MKCRPTLRLTWINFDQLLNLLIGFNIFPNTLLASKCGRQMRRIIQIQSSKWTQLDSTPEQHLHQTHSIGRLRGVSRVEASGVGLPETVVCRMWIRADVNIREKDGLRWRKMEEIGSKFGRKMD